MTKVRVRVVCYSFIKVSETSFEEARPILQKVPLVLMVVLHGHFPKFIPHIFNWIQVRQLPPEAIHLDLLEKVVHQERHMFRIVVMAKDEATAQTSFTADCFRFPLKILHICLYS